ncbi:MAG: hypothetical protein QM737_12885 [Ferruginibacter sp.]
MKHLLTALLFTTILFSCKKSSDDNNNNNQQKSKTTLLTQAPWYHTLVQKRSSPSDPWETNNFSMQPCGMDDIFTFGSTGSYLWDDGATDCGTSPQTLESGTWVFANNETHMTVTLTNTPGVTPVQDWTIEQLDENTLIYSYYFATGPYYRKTMAH